MASYNCFNCGRIAISIGEKMETCPACGSKNGKFISNEALKEFIDTGTFSKIVMNSGGRKKTSEKIR